jgi:flavin-binding protein dodecin
LELSEKWIKNRINNMLTTHAEEMLYLRWAGVYTKEGKIKNGNVR